MTTEHERMLQAIEGELTARERRVLFLRYGIESPRGMTYSKIGKIIGRTAPTVRQIVLKSIRKFRCQERLAKILGEDFP